MENGLSRGWGWAWRQRRPVEGHCHPYSRQQKVLAENSYNGTREEPVYLRHNLKSHVTTFEECMYMDFVDIDTITKIGNHREKKYFYGKMFQLGMLSLKYLGLQVVCVEQFQCPWALPPLQLCCGLWFLCSWFLQSFDSNFQKFLKIVSEDIIFFFLVP